jgi:hypothetical protein
MTAAVTQDVATSATADPDTPLDTWFTAFRRSFYVIRVPIAMAIIVSLVLILPEQVQEIYRALAQDRPNRPGIQLHWPLALVSLAALSLVLWQVARGLTYEYPRHYGTPRHPVARWVLAWVPRLLVAVPLLSAALGLWLSIVVVGQSVGLLEDFVEGVNRLRLDFAIAIGTSVLVGLLLLVVATVFERWLARRGPDVARKVALYSNWVIFPLIAAASVAVICTDQIAMAQMFGALPIFALWMSILALLVGMLARLSLFAIPVLSLMVAYGLGIEFFKLADNHAIRGEPKEILRPDLEAAFTQWLANRKDLAAYQAAQRPYPVYIVAAEGGGLYAGYMTGRMLARIQDLCPGFAHHVFTISSVSGGSLGAAVFAGLVADDPKLGDPTPCKEDTTKRFGPMERQAHRILSDDFLSPAVWAGLYPDFLQRFIPRPLPQLDRAVYLEKAFEQAWPKSAVNNPMTQSFFDVCGPGLGKCLKGSTPLLAFNVTNVETGLQVVLSPMDLSGATLNTNPSGGTPSQKIFDFFEPVGLDTFDLQLSTAVGLSARFPYISPPGWYAWRDERPGPGSNADSKESRFTFVDGGYVDNSGVATALAIAQRLDAVKPRPNVEFRILMLSALWAPIERLWIRPPQNLRNGELTPPLEAAWSARQGRGYKTQYDASLEAKPGLSVSEIGFFYDYLEPPLGWQLSDVTRRYIRLFRGEPGRCPLESEEKYTAYTTRSVQNNDEAAAAYIRRADCVMARIKNELTPTDPPVPASYPPINTAR